MIHVCFGLHDKTGRYSKFTGTAVLSMFENHNTLTRRLPSITVHILHDNTLSTDNRDKFSYVAGQYGQLVKFYNVEELCAEKIEQLRESPMKRSMARYSVGAIFRFLIPHVFSTEIKKVIYLDSDIIVNLNINELWQIELDKKYSPSFLK